MSYLIIGAATVTAETDRVSIGSFSGDLVNGQLLLKISTVFPSDMSGLAFGIVSFLETASNVRVLGDTRYYPKPEPTVISLGYGNRASVTGTLIFEPRPYNLRWLTAAYGPKSWTIFVEADGTNAVTQPEYVPTSYGAGSDDLSATAVIGSDGNTYGMLTLDD